MNPAVDRYPHIKRFIDRVRGLNLGNNQPVVFQPQDVRDLSADITKLLLELNNNTSKDTGVNFQDVVLSGGNFK